MNKSLKKHRKLVIETAENNLKYLYDLIRIKSECINTLRSLGYSKKRSQIITEELIRLSK